MESGYTVNEFIQENIKKKLHYVDIPVDEDMEIGREMDLDELSSLFEDDRNCQELLDHLTHGMTSGEKETIIATITELTGSEKLMQMVQPADVPDKLRAQDGLVRIVLWWR